MKAGVELRYRLDGKIRSVFLREEGLSFFWPHFAKSRDRWLKDPKFSKDLVAAAREKFNELGLSHEHLRQIGSAKSVEVVIPFDNENTSWASRVCPWEFLLTELTRAYRTQPVLVMRRIKLSKKFQTARSSQPKSLLFVENNPPPFKYNYELEEELVRRQLDVPRHSRLTNPSRKELSAKISSFKPDVLHLAGCDNHQALELLKIGGLLEPSAELKFRDDGLVMASDSADWDPVEARHLAELINPPKKSGGTFSPLLVVFNCYNSGARLASMAVARGAGAALGFYDEIGDADAERFYATFYRRWRLSHWNLGLAFGETIAELRDGSGTLDGSAIVLWTRASVLEDTLKNPPETNARRAEAGGRSAAARKLFNVRERVFASVVAPDRVNYSRLHAGEPLFRRFNICRRDAQDLDDVEVEVILHVGEGSFPYRERVIMSPDVSVHALERNIHLPLLSRTQRALRESALSSLYYRICCGAEVIEEKTLSIELSAINEWWWDDNDDGKYLASFVLPGDAAIRTTIAAAQKYLRSLRDDYGAGFDGYQSDDTESVDLEVRSIWTALSFEFMIDYIEPPPSFSEATQRLRTPTEVLQGGRGTCIDLALLLSACLEYVGIHSVVFVLKDHAFPGYWRSEPARNEFNRVDMSESDKNSPDKRDYSEFNDMMRHIREGNLVPIETVTICNKSSFDTAREEALRNFEDTSRWGKLLDVLTARDQGAKPIPILQGEA